jgi:glycosyltransferase involved in cell wall biosynthesis
MAEKKGIIWFVNKDCAPIEEFATLQRTVKQAQYFQAQGYNVKVVCSARVHNTNINHIQKGLYKEEIYDGVPFLFVKTSPYRDNGFKRIWAYVLFAYDVYRLRNKFEHPTVVVHTSRIPFDFYILKLVKKVKAKYIIDITDLWPRNFETVGLVKHDNVFLKLLYKFERKFYETADHVVFSMEGYKDYLRDKKWDIESGGTIDFSKTHYVNNGIDLHELEDNMKEYSIEDVDLEDDMTFKVIYLGSIRQANHLESLIDAAKELKGYTNIKILIYGDGPDRNPLEKRVAEEHIDNVIFKQRWIELQYVPYVLSKAGINLLNYSKGWGHYGGSMNKMMMSYAIGKPIVCNVGMRYSPIRDNNLGIDRCFESSKEYADAILEIYKLPKEEYDAMCQRTRETSKQFDMPLLCERFKDYCGL